MDWKEYEVKPDEGMFDAVQGRVRKRRYWRLAGGVITFAVAAAVIVLSTMPNTTAEEVQQVAETIQPVNSLSATVTDDMVVADVQPTVGKRQQAIEQDEEAVTVLPQAQMQLVTVREPEQEPSFDTVLFEQFAKLQSRENVSRGSSAVKEEQSEDVQKEASTDEVPAKVGSANIEAEKIEGILWAPNIITPNGDVVKNRSFRLVAMSDVSDFHIYIYNRGGRIVFRSSNIEEEWDARHNGVQVPQGAYVWVATFSDADGVSHREAGTITVVW